MLRGSRAQACFDCKKERFVERFKNYGATGADGRPLPFKEAFDNALRSGAAECGAPSGCGNQMPLLSAYDAQVLVFFLSRGVQNLWRRSDYTGVRQCIPRADLEVEARARGVELSEYFLERFAMAESVLSDFDRERLAQQQE